MIGARSLVALLTRVSLSLVSTPALNLRSIMTCSITHAPLSGRLSPSGGLSSLSWPNHQYVITLHFPIDLHVPPLHGRYNGLVIVSLYMPQRHTTYRRSSLVGRSLPLAAFILTRSPILLPLHVVLSCIFTLYSPVHTHALCWALNSLHSMANTLDLAGGIITQAMSGSAACASCVGRKRAKYRSRKPLCAGTCSSSVHPSSGNNGRSGSRPSLVVLRIVINCDETPSVTITSQNHTIPKNTDPSPP